MRLWLHYCELFGVLDKVCRGEEGRRGGGKEGRRGGGRRGGGKEGRRGGAVREDVW